LRSSRVPISRARSKTVSFARFSTERAVANQNQFIDARDIRY